MGVSPVWAQQAEHPADVTDLLSDLWKEQKKHILWHSSETDMFLLSDWMIITLLDLKLRPCMPCLQKAKTLSCKHTEEDKEKQVNTQHT